MKKFKLLTTLLSFLFITGTIFGAGKVKTPIYTSMSPVSGYIGTTVTINGSNFSNVTSVKIGTVSQSFRVVSGTKITFTVGSGTSTGIVYITNPYGTTGGATFAVINPLTITSVTPTSGVMGTQINIYGTGLGYVNSVKINGVSVNYTIAGGNYITVIVQPYMTGSGPITMTDGYGNSCTGPVFTVTPSSNPFVYSTQPSQGPPGTVITLFGSNFNTVTSVTYNNAPVTYTIVNNNTMTVIAPPTITYMGTIVVTNPYGWDYGIFSVVVTTPPVITSVTPSTVNVGDTVKVYGQYLTGVTQIWIGNTVVSAFERWSDSYIKFYVTSNLTSGWMSFVSPYGNTAGPYLTIVSVPTPRMSNTNLMENNYEYYDIYGKNLGNDYDKLPFNQLILAKYIKNDEVTIDKIIKQY